MTAVLPESDRDLAVALPDLTDVTDVTGPTHVLDHPLLRGFPLHEARVIVLPRVRWARGGTSHYDVVRDALFTVAAARLTAVAPDWRSRVDPRTLEMDSGTRCVLGQTFGSYDVGCRRLYGRDVASCDCCWYGTPLDALTFGAFADSQPWLELVTA